MPGVSRKGVPTMSFTLQTSGASIVACDNCSGSGVIVCNQPLAGLADRAQPTIEAKWPCAKCSGSGVHGRPHRWNYRKWWA